MRPFIDPHLLPEDYWRAIVLFGRNVACYKFALARALLEISPVSGQLIKLDDLAGPFAKQVARHLEFASKQSTSQSSKFLDACRRYNSGELKESSLIDQTTRLGFVNVIDAFHIIGNKEVPIRYFTDERSDNKGIRITDEFSVLAHSEQYINLPLEAEARWRLVETAWELGVSRNIVVVHHDAELNMLFALDRSSRRKSITGSRDAIGGYQKGRCFYCLKPIELKKDTHVDHFFPHCLKPYLGPSVDGVWNLVLACVQCNSGVNGKFEQIPTLRLLERLFIRNEFLIGSHHPLRETLIAQTGADEKERQTFLNRWHTQACTHLIHQWESPYDANRLA